MDEEKIGEKSTKCTDGSIATRKIMNNRPLLRKTFLVYPTLPKENKIDREIIYIQKKFSAIKIDLRCQKMPLSKSKKRRLRRKRQAHARHNKITLGLETVAKDQLIV